MTHRGRGAGRSLPTVVTAAVMAALAMLAGGCATERTEAEPSIGQVERTATIRAMGMALVTDGRDAARLVGTLLNESKRPDRLVGIDVDTEIGTFAVTLADGPVVLAPNEPFHLAREGDVTVFSDYLRKGFRVKATLVFRHSPPIVTNLPVESQSGPYANVEVIRPSDGQIRP